MRDASGARTTFEYDEDGNRTAVIDAEGRRTGLGLIRFGGQSDYAACLSVNAFSNSAGLT